LFASVVTFQLSFDVGIVTIFGGRLDERRKAELRKNYSVVEKGYNSFPNSLPGTLHYKAMQVSTHATRHLHNPSNALHVRYVSGNGSTYCPAPGTHACM
jgi:hypothetical protein